MSRLVLAICVLSIVILFLWFSSPRGQLLATAEWMLAGLAEAVGFGTKVSEPARPATVPETAIWAGGADGGAWIECVVDESENANWCTVWNDQTGSVWARTHFVLDDTGGPAVDMEQIDLSFDGTRIKLGNGRTLEPREFHRDPDVGPWEKTPIDPPRPSDLHRSHQ